MARIGDYESAPDASPAAWIIAGLRGSGESVLSLVPEGFEAYARIFHPAYRGEPLAPVRWRDVATANGRVAHRVMQWPSITGSFPFTSSSAQPGLWDWEPEEGSLPEELATILAAVLAPLTATPAQCWFAVWDGYAALALADDQAPVFEIPHRRMLMLTGRSLPSGRRWARRRTGSPRTCGGRKTGPGRRDGSGPDVHLRRRHPAVHRAADPSPGAGSRGHRSG